MPDFDKAEFLAKIIHVVQNDNELCATGFAMIMQGEKKGLFDKVKFGREINQTKDEQSKT